MLQNKRLVDVMKNNLILFAPKSELFYFKCKATFSSINHLIYDAPCITIAHLTFLNISSYNFVISHKFI